MTLSMETVHKNVQLFSEDKLCMITLKKELDAILDNDGDEIDISAGSPMDKKVVSKCAGGIAFLEACGFVQDGDCMKVKSKDAAFITRARDLLRKTIVSGYQPYDPTAEAAAASAPTPTSPKKSPMLDSSAFKLSFGGFDAAAAQAALEPPSLDDEIVDFTMDLPTFTPVGDDLPSLKKEKKKLKKAVESEAPKSPKPNAAPKSPKAGDKATIKSPRSKKDKVKVKSDTDDSDGDILMDDGTPRQEFLDKDFFEFSYYKLRPYGSVNKSEVARVFCMGFCGKWTALGKSRDPRYTVTIDESETLVQKWNDKYSKATLDEHGVYHGFHMIGAPGAPPSPPEAAAPAVEALEKKKGKKKNDDGNGKADEAGTKKKKKDGSGKSPATKKKATVAINGGLPGDASREGAAAKPTKKKAAESAKALAKPKLNGDEAMAALTALGANPAKPKLEGAAAVAALSSLAAKKKPGSAAEKKATTKKKVAPKKAASGDADAPKTVKKKADGTAAPPKKSSVKDGSAVVKKKKAESSQD